MEINTIYLKISKIGIKIIKDVYLKNSFLKCYKT